MPNRNSNAGHIATRTCVVCRTKAPATDMLSFVLIHAGLVFDIENRIQARKYHLCHADSCMEALPKWKQRQLKKRGAKRTTGSRS